MKKRAKRLQQDAHVKPWIRLDGKPRRKSNQDIWDFLRGVEEADAKSFRVKLSQVKRLEDQQ